nr:MAG TPA: hypothetical protein [Caudoviricetes sp.]
MIETDIQRRQSVEKDQNKRSPAPEAGREHPAAWA